MKASEIFKQYIWLTDTIYRSGGISLQELNERWVRTEMSGGVPMTRMTFNRHKMAIEEIFGLCIECQRKGGYYYYIENEEVLKNNNLQDWLLDSLSISNMLMESGSLKDRIMLENIPAGKEYLQPIINAMKQDYKLMMTYRKFGQTTGYTITVEPYAIKVFKQRWYLLAKDNKRETPTIYALDRILALEETEESFVYPSDFDTELFFKDYYGVLCSTKDKAQKIVIRTYPPFTNYLRTLPLHHSQKEVKTTPDYADFEFHLRPTFDFRQELLSQCNEVEVLKPAKLREEMKEMIGKMLERYR
ncbi:MAG: WYL domain-containing protein [Bacteroidaceae bacterium]|nr:WYL domain-containing protein [Bacteroidaceae bacterium]